LRQTGRDVRSLGGLRIAAIGPGTADALSAFHLIADLVPDDFRSERLAEKLAERAAGLRILLARADRGRDVLPTELAKVAMVEQVTVYRQVKAALADTEAGAALRRGEIDYVTLTSSNIARAFLESLDAQSQARVRSGETQLVTISPVTSGAVAELGYKAAAEATEYTTEGLLRALVELAAKVMTDRLSMSNGTGSENSVLE
jgi:uroporphyrinogen III methyltransferase/synthase